MYRFLCAQNILKIFSLPRWQDMLILRDSFHSEKSEIWRKRWVCEYTILSSNLRKDKKSQHIQPHKEPFQETKCVPHRSQSNHRSSRKFKGIVPQPSQQKTKVEKGFFIKFCGCSFCLMEWTLWKSMEAHKGLEKIVSERTLSAWTENTDGTK